MSDGTKLVWARQLELIAHAITNELRKDEPDFTAIAFLLKDIDVHRAHLANQLANEGAIIDG
jgi:hypothetical protein